MEKESYKYPEKDGFRDALKAAVDEYFETHKIAKTGDWRIYSKTIILYAFIITTYAILVFYTPSTWIAVILAMIEGLLVAAIGFNVMHDGSHGSYSQKQWVNKLAALSANAMGANATLWNTKHNIIHHTDTNTPHDDDIQAEPLMRMHPEQPHYAIHRVQHWYALFLYLFLYLVWVWWNDFRKYFAQAIGVKRFEFSKNDHVIFWVSKLFYITVMLIIPMHLVGILPTIIGYLILAGTCGVTMSVIFQLAHVVEKSTFPAPQEGSTVINHTSWAKLQVEETADFATKSRLLRIFVGGLNFQVVHHLFPKVSHIHYPKIQPIVKRICEEHGVVYTEFKTFWHGLSSHLRQLKKLGQV